MSIVSTQTKRAAVAGVVGVFTACSFVSVREPQRPAPDRELDCTTSAPTADTITAILMLGLGGLLIYGGRTSDSFGGALIGYYVGIPLAVMGGVYTTSAIWGHTATSRCERMKDAQTAQRETEAARREVQEVVWQITKTAAAHARAGECPRVIELGAKVRVIDRDFYDSVFARDVAIARCLADPGPGSAVAPSP